MIKLKLYGTELTALIDDEFEHIQRYRWRLSDKGLVYRHGNKVVRLHQVILGSKPLPGFIVNWRNGNRLDCRSANLHCIPLSLKAEISAPSRPNRSGGARGVCFDRSRGKFVAQLTVNGVARRLGRFDTLEEATEAVRDLRRSCGGIEPRITQACTRVHGPIVEKGHGK